MQQIAMGCHYMVAVSEITVYYTLKYNLALIAAISKLLNLWIDLRTSQCNLYGICSAALDKMIV